MTLGSLAFLTPWGAVVAAFALLPLAAYALAERRVRRARELLRLPAPRHRGLRHGALLALVSVLLGVAAAQPAVRTHSAVRARTDAAVFVVVDVSRSMAAAPSPGAPSRLDRAKRAAIALRARIPDTPVGLATLTDRVLPSLFPSVDAAAFDSAVEALGIDDPPPRESSTVATTFDALSALATQGFFQETQRTRAVALVTDGESRPFAASAVRRALDRARISLVAMRVGGPADRVRVGGAVEPGFRPDTAAAELALRRLGGGTLETALGTGPVGTVGQTTRLRSLAPAFALAALVPLVLLLGGRRSSPAAASRESLPFAVRRRRSAGASGE